MQTVIKRKRSRIHKLKRPDGTWCSDGGELQSMVQNFYKNLFGADQRDRYIPMVTPSFLRMSAACMTTLLEEVTKAEVRTTLMSMKSYKAPGPDGFKPFFFKTYWDKVGDDVWRLVRDAFASGGIPSKLAETLVVLIPKGDYPSSLGDFHPISLCNVVYKIITNVL